MKKRIKDLATEFIKEGLESVEISCSVLTKKCTIKVERGTLKIVKKGKRKEVYLFVNGGRKSKTFAGRTFVSNAKPI